MNIQLKETTACNKCKWKQIVADYFPFYECRSPNTRKVAFYCLTGEYFTYPKCEDKNEGNCPDFERKLSLLEEIRQWTLGNQKK